MRAAYPPKILPILPTLCVRSVCCLCLVNAVLVLAELPEIRNNPTP